MDIEKNNSKSDYVIVKALENGVTISAIALEDSDTEMPVRLDEGELYIMRINPSLRGYKLRGDVELQTKLGIIKGDSNIIVESGHVE
jgi:hypothetical protein